jgi:hypothetical protein
MAITTNDPKHPGSVKSRIHDTCLVAEPVTIAIEGRITELSLRDAKLLLTGLLEAVARVEQAKTKLIGDGFNYNVAVIAKPGAGMSLRRTKLGEGGVIYTDDLSDYCSDAFKEVLRLGVGERPQTILSLMDMGSEIERLSLFARAADVALSPEEQETCVAIMKSLPAGATIRDFADACDTDTSVRLGISLEALESISPLLSALRTMDDPDRHNRVFNEA